jgi:HAE1 family hydrophobic/amphiphilic exporter-1
VGESIRDVTYTVGGAIALVILVIFIFLGDWRTTMIHFIATPVSLIGTFVFVKLLGFSVNTLTLFGITLATGLVVDDAIVVIENIERHMREGEHDSRKAAAAATAEITGAVIATSLVLVAVFVPVAFFPGTTGILFRQFALTIAFSIAISAFNALTLAPVLASILLRESHGEKWWPLRKFDDGVQAMTNGYLFCFHTRADGIRTRRGPGLFHHRDPSSVGSFAGIYEGNWEAGFSPADRRFRGARNILDRGIQFCRCGGEPGTYFRPTEAI